MPEAPELLDATEEPQLEGRDDGEETNPDAAFIGKGNAPEHIGQEHRGGHRAAVHTDGVMGTAVVLRPWAAVRSRRR